MTAKAANRIAELSAVLDGMPAVEARAALPSMWTERATLVRQRDELLRLESKRADEAKAREQADAFALETIEPFRKRADSVGRSLNVEATALEKALDGMKALQLDYNKLYAAGTAAGAKVPRLAELSSVGDRRLQRIELVIHLLSMGDE